MSELKKLLQGVEVEWKALGDVGNVKMCKRIFKNETHDTGEIPFYKIGTFGKKADAYISKELYELYKSKYPYPNIGEVLISASGTIGRTVIYNGEPAYFQDSNIIWLENDESIVSNAYLWHFYKIAKWYVSDGGIIKRLYNDNVRKTKILIPHPNDQKKSLKIQEEIVRILDNLSEETSKLTAALQSELDSHQKRYEYYREELFKFEGKEVEWSKLNNIICNTENIKWNVSNKTYKYIDLSSVDKDKNMITNTIEINSKTAPSRAQKIILENDIIFATTRPTQLRVCIISNEFSNQIASTGFCILRANKNIVLPKWIFHQLTTYIFKNYLEENQSGSAYPAISDSKVKNFKIPIPYPSDSKKSLQEQNRIVKILDEFDAAAQAITTEIKKEIELRNRQFEYYRDLLLTFPK